MNERGSRPIQNIRGVWFVRRLNRWCMSYGSRLLWDTMLAVLGYKPCLTMSSSSAYETMSSGGAADLDP
jgi:hypothetical protein